MYPRKIRQYTLEALDDSPVVLVNGARQTGKSTLVRTLEQDVRYFTFDDPAVLAAAQADPFGFIGALEGAVCLDEVQRAPGIFLAIKAEVDKDRTPGRFLLTGSANVLLLPQIADSLAGRMEVLTLWPLAQSEIASRPISMIDRLFDGGHLSNHRIFWNMRPGSFETDENTRIQSTVTEMIYIPDSVADGRYLLNLQIAPFEADCSPSRPVLLVGSVK